jgi:nucleotide-binding universal stress UspA family protein
MNSIVVGIDGSPHSKAALLWALDEAKLRGATLRVVHAWSLPAVTAAQGFAPVFDAELLDVLRQDAEDLVERALAEVDAEKAGVQIERELVHGPPAQALVEAAEDADLLVTGSHGRGGFAGLLLGSVSQQAAHHAACPVVIVRGKHSEED